MADIYLGLGLILALSALFLLIGLKLDRKLSKRASLLIVALTIAGLFLYCVFLRESALLTKVLPFKNLIMTGNWLILFGAFMSGLAYARIPGGKVRRGIYCGLLLCACLFTLLAPLIGARPEGADYWTRDAIAIQSSNSSCSPACAATLLATAGIRTSEKEMIDLCLTKKNGTLWYGLYRGLKLKTAGTPYDVEVLHGTVAELQSGKLQGPLILSVRLDQRATTDGRFEKNWGWAPGVAHAVVFFRMIGTDRIEVGDPSIGRERWDMYGLETLWHGDAMRLVKR